MTTNYTYTRPETLKQQIETALGLWSQSLELARTIVIVAVHGRTAACIFPQSPCMEVLS